MPQAIATQIQKLEKTLAVSTIIVPLRYSVTMVVVMESNVTQVAIVSISGVLMLSARIPNAMPLPPI